MPRTPARSPACGICRRPSSSAEIAWSSSWTRARARRAGPPFVILHRPAPSPATLALRGRALGDGRVIADIDAAVEARVGRDVRWSNVTVEVTLIDTGAGDVWAATGGQRVWRSAPGDSYDLSFFPRTLRAVADEVAAGFRPVDRRAPGAGGRGDAGRDGGRDAC